ncbi:TELO2-interacting protein 2-like isoform X2 [Gigantopelta aegis]|nr:TELO2-interacting protein 2-like isoform X2 [Gigantopelta aegis]XP_041372313.1 TELO2-interacting protein 2-like isoform X2 [Gigantopelta aegis]
MDETPSCECDKKIHTDTDKGILQLFKLAASSQNHVTLLDISVKIEQLSAEYIYSCLKSSVMPDLLIQTIKTAIVGELPEREHCQYEEQDFVGTADKTDAVLKNFASIFHHLNSLELLESAVMNCLNKVLPSLLLLLSANMTPAAWNSSGVVDQSMMLSQCMLKLYKCDTTGKLLTLNMDSQNHDFISPSSSLFGKYLRLVKPCLDRDRWKRNPFVQASFIHLLTSVKQSSISEHLTDILPPSLNFIDDFVVENKISGIKCLRHIIANTSSEELRWYGRAEVVYEAVKHQLYTKNATLLQDAIPTVLAVVRVVERTPDNIHSGLLLDVNRYDEIFQMLLHDAELENNIHIRRALTSHLWKFVDELGIGVVRHMKNVVHLVSNFLEIYDGPEETSRLNALMMLKSLIKNAWPRVYSHCEEILKCLLKLLYDLAVDETTTSKEVKDNLHDESVSCLVLLRYCCPRLVESYLNELNKPETAECIRETVQLVMQADVPCC